MDYYEQWNGFAPANDDSCWNSCLCLCQRYHLHAEPEDTYEPVLGD